MVDGTTVGSVYVFSGATGNQLAAFHGDPNTQVLGDQVSGAGDVNGDGIADIIVSTGNAYSGRFQVWSVMDQTLLVTWIYGEQVIPPPKF